MEVDCLSTGHARSQTPLGPVGGETDGVCGAKHHPAPSRERRRGLERVCPSQREDDVVERDGGALCHRMVTLNSVPQSGWWHNHQRMAADILAKVPYYSAMGSDSRHRLVQSRREAAGSDHPDSQSRTDPRRFDVRLASFHMPPHPWPLSMPSAERMARVGFWYSGSEDAVKCHSCGIQLSDWAEPGSPEPLLRHYTTSPSCSFILQAFREQLPQLQAQLDVQRSQFSNISSRLHSFSSWPYGDIVTSYQLASVGFYYTRESAKVVCFSCGVTVSEWKRGDVPLLVHRNRSPHCPFLLSIITKGPVAGPAPTPGPQVRPSGEASGASLPDWSNPQTRLKSFKKLDRRFFISREELADSGLYLLRLPDVMKCHSCGVVLDQWASEDMAVDKHWKASPNCPFLSHMFPSKALPSEEPTFDPSSLPAPQFDEKALELLSLRHSLESLSSHATPSLDPPKVLRQEQGHGQVPPHHQIASLSLHDTHYHTLPNSHPPPSLSTTTHLSLPSQLSFLPSSQPLPSLPSPPQSLYTDPQPLSLSASLNPSPSHPPHQPSSSSSSAGPYFPSATIMGKSVSLPPSYLHSSITTAAQMPTTMPSVSTEAGATGQTSSAECVVCMDHPLEVVLVPCGHICVCEECAGQITRCPMCRTKKQMSVKVYYPY